MPATRAAILAFAQRHKLATLASVSPTGAPEAAVVGIAVSDTFEFVFDTLRSTRKYANLKANPKIAFVVGWDGAETLQYEGLAEQLSGADLGRYQALYFTAWPDGPSRLAWPGITYFKVSPTWLRYSDFAPTPPALTELTFPA